MDKNLRLARTDLAVECIESENIEMHGILHHSENVNGIQITRVNIQTDNAAKNLGKPIGKYVTVETTPFYHFTPDFKNQTEIVGNEIKKLLPDGVILVIGLGNSAITPDALGPEVINLIFATRHLSDIVAFKGLRSTAAVAPGVLGQTGIETAEIVSGIVNTIKPDGVIVIDALAARELSRLGATVQISDTGITPGSGVANHRKALTKETLGVPVISVGVPTVVNIKNFCDIKADNMVVTPREIDTIIENAAKTVGFGINLALQPTLSLDEIISLVN